MENATSTNISNRLSRLERILGDAESKESIRRRLQHLKEKLKETGDVGKWIGTVGLEMNVPEDSAAPEDPAIRESLILASDEIVRAVGTQLNEIHQLQKFINVDRLNHQDEWVRRLDTLATRQDRLMTEAMDVQRRAASIVETYHRITEALSLKFVEWDRLLKNVENEGA